MIQNDYQWKANSQVSGRR